MSQPDKDALQKLMQSGKILRETRQEIKNHVHEGTPIINICEKAEQLIRQKGAKPAFPCNVSTNEIAAHYTSPPNDTKTIPEKSLVKIDIGAHIDGHITDTAITISLNPEYNSLAETAEAALAKATENVNPQTTTAKLGTIIENTIKTKGFKPISNLTGHSLGRYLVHSGTSLPNVAQLIGTKLKIGQTYAIEPFVTLQNAAGKVKDEDEKTIFRLVKQRSQKNPHAKKLLQHIEDNYKTLPFAERWLKNIIPEQNYTEAFRELLKTKAIMAYPVFVEMSRKPVAQAEHTVLITEDGCKILT